MNEISSYSKKDRIIAFILLLSIVKNPLYSFIENIFAVYLGTGHSEGAFAVICSAIFFLNCVLFILFKPKLSLHHWMMIIILFCWGLLGLLQSYFNGLSNGPFYFFVFAFDVIIWTCVAFKEKLFGLFSYYFGIYAFWYGVASVLTTFGSLLLTGQVRTVGVGNYQGVSYGSAFSYGLIWFYYLKCDWFKKKYKYSWCLLPLLFVATILPGGRGAFVLLFAYTFWCLGIIIKDGNEFRLKKTIKPTTLIISFLFFAVVLYFLFTNITDYLDVFVSGFERAISFFDFSTMSLDFENGSSDRGPIYEYALAKIAERPMTGYGIYGYLYIGLAPYPHNIILEILLQYGIVLGLPLLVMLVVLELRLFRRDNFLQLCISFYVFVMLMFSGSYTANSYFWFLLAFALSDMLEVKNNSKIKYHISYS